MHDHDILPAKLLAKLPDSLYEMQSFDISDGTSYLHDSYIMALCERSDPFFDLVSDMWNDLYRLPKEISPSLFFYHRKIDLSGSDATLARHVLIDEPLVMTEIQIGFESICRDECLPMLEG